MESQHHTLITRVGPHRKPSDPGGVPKPQFDNTQQVSQHVDRGGGKYRPLLVHKMALPTSKTQTQSLYPIKFSNFRFWAYWVKLNGIDSKFGEPFCYQSQIIFTTNFPLPVILEPRGGQYVLRNHYFHQVIRIGGT